MDTITLGAGCFWCVEAIFTNIKGVEKVSSGYMGGHTKNPQYKEVCNETTGHAEVIEVIFSSSIVSLETILEVFFKTHDPTTLNQQGNDKGTQYRSAIFYYNDEQKEIAQKILKKIESEKIYANKIVTEISPASTFYIAENYHQDYFALNGEAPYCKYVIEPKIKKFNSLFENLKK